ncbi:response regulator [Pseudobacteriovorax antillogorgiicola]|uniref:Response regulator receiver domain-containing protein n=1 Tax=Pseudobacteriovorax antillogorgiicola TaxID=1513793 RepID=A0A1Y6BQT2_9BACT|nr:response regulator [Pseudobacteriovorax antillogorgiicola]TCS53781.1 response regulator receiver domain-containing protein [Pseudobacteriovorax antillogorgiicola]SMF22316.1 Response regulator receiver domain-containing protein [Pseudobacteriovorax antillogorgiicola]
MVRYEKKPFSELLKSAHEGDRDAKSSVGLLHELGLLKDSDIREALKWFEEAANDGDPIAAISAAEIYRHGCDGLSPDPRKADQLYELAESLGFERPEKRVPRPTPHEPSKEVIVGKKMLIIDKPGSYVTQMKQELVGTGYKPIEVHDLRELPKTLTLHQDIHCIFVDLTISAPNFVQVLAAIRKFKAFKTTPIVVVTEITDINVIKKAKGYNINGWILKPIKEQLVAGAAKRLAG